MFDGRQLAPERVSVCERESKQKQKKVVKKDRSTVEFLLM